jgi:uncharacterized protein
MMTATTTCTAFIGNNRFASGPVAEVALALWSAPALSGPEAAMAVVFDDATGHAIDIDTRGTPEEVVSRLEQPAAAEDLSLEPRGRGRPRLGVVAREVTLLPRHWDWLGGQPGRTSVTLRKLVDQARRASGDRDRIRTAQEAAYRFMSAMAGNLAGFEEASRALFAYDRRRFAELIAEWPADVREYCVKLAFADLDPGER